MAEQTEISSTHASSNTLEEKSAEIPTNDTATTLALPPIDTVRTSRISIVVPARAENTSHRVSKRGHFVSRHVCSRH